MAQLAAGHKLVGRSAVLALARHPEIEFGRFEKALLLRDDHAMQNAGTDFAAALQGIGDRFQKRVADPHIERTGSRVKLIKLGVG